MITRISSMLLGAMLCLLAIFASSTLSAEVKRQQDPSASIVPIESMLGDPAKLSQQERYTMSRTLLKTAMRGMRHLKFHMHFDPTDGTVSIHADEDHGMPGPYPEEEVEPDHSDEF